MKAADSPKSAGEMMSDILGNVGNLVRNEVDLARTEITNSANKAVGALGLMAFAFLLAIAGLNVLAASLVALVIWMGVPPAWATVIVGVVLMVCAYVIFLSAKSALKHVGFMPTRTARNIQHDAAAIKEAYNDK